MSARKQQIEFLVKFFWNEFCEQESESWCITNQWISDRFCEQFGDILNHRQWKDRIKASAEIIGLTVNN